MNKEAETEKFPPSTSAQWGLLHNRDCDLADGLFRSKNAILLTRKAPACRLQSSTFIILFYLDGVMCESGLAFISLTVEFEIPSISYQSKVGGGAFLINAIWG